MIDSLKDKLLLLSLHMGDYKSNESLLPVAVDCPIF